MSEKKARPWAWGCLTIFLIFIGLAALMEQGRDAATSNPRAAVADQWLRASGRGYLTSSQPLPAWEGGSRLGVRNNKGDELVFYFSAAGDLCSVLAKGSQERLYDSKECS